MTFAEAIDAYLADMWSEGRVTSKGTDRAYRDALYRHLDDVTASGRNWTTSDRRSVKATMARWSNPNTVKGRLAALVSFYDWTMQEGYRKDNPARQVRRPRKRKANVYRMTRDEAVAMLSAAAGKYERRIITLGICHGLRNAELRGLRGQHFGRPGFIWLSSDIAKGGRERWVPVIVEALAVVEEIRATVGDGEYILPRQVPQGGAAQVIRGGDPLFKEDASRPCSSQHIWRVVGRVAKKAGIRAHIHPHLMRHAYADHVSRYSGVKAAQALLGHADIGTTQGYLDTPTLDELAHAVDGFGFTSSTPTLRGVETAHTRPAGFEPADTSIWPVEPSLRGMAPSSGRFGRDAGTPSRLRKTAPRSSWALVDIRAGSTAADFTAAT